MTDGVIILAVGLRGYGKTSQLRRLCGYDSPAGASLRDPRRLIVCDPEKRWRPRGDDVVVQGGPALLAELERVGAADPRRRFRIVYHDDAEAMQLAGPAAAFAYRHLTLAVDELVWMCHAHYMPRYLKKLIQVGRERGVNLLATTREPQEVHDLFFSQANLIYFFHVQPGNGLDRIRGRYRKIAAELEHLGRFQYRIHSIEGEPAALANLGREGLDSPAPPGALVGRQRRRRSRESP